MTLDTAARKLADKLANKYGKTVTLRRKLRAAYDPATGTGGGELAPTDYSVKITPPENFMFQNLDGTLIQEGDCVVSLPALNSPVTPSKQTDTMVIDGEEWIVRQIAPLYSGELVALYVLHLGR